MKKYITILILLCTAFHAFAENTITFSSVEGTIGKEVTVCVSLTNSDAVSGIQLTIPLDNNLTFVENSQTKSARLGSHELAAGVKNGMLTLMVYSYSMAAIIGNSGEILTFKLLLGENPGNYNLSASSVKLSGLDGSSVSTTTQTATVTVCGPKLQIPSYNKTLNFDGAIGSYSSQSVYLQNVGNEPLVISDISFSNSAFSLSYVTLPVTINAGESKYAYVGCKPTTRGKLDETMTIISNGVPQETVIRLTATPYAVNELRLVNTSGSTGEEVTVDISMKNMDAISALQMEITMPNDVEYVDGSFILSDRKQDHGTSTSFANGVLRLVAYSPTDKTFTGNDGVVGSFKVKIVGSNNATLRVQQAMMTSTIDGKITNVLSSKYNCTVSVNSSQLSTDSSLDFGDVSITQQNVQKSFTIRNGGSSPLTINNVFFANGLFSVKEQLPLSIDASTSKTLTILCDAEESGDISTDMEIYSNDPNKKLHIVKVTGRIYEPNTMTCNVVVDDRIPTISMSVDNYSDIYGIQFDLEASYNFTLSSSDIHLSTRSEALPVTVNTLSENKVRVMAYSQGAAFMASGNGEVMSITLSPNEPLEDGNYDITLSNIVLGSKNLSNMYAGTTIVTPFSIRDYTLGDANGDGVVNVIDVVTTIDYILVKNPAGFIFKAADVNNDELVNIIDVVGIIDIILGRWSAAPMHRALTDETEQDQLRLIQNNDHSLSLCMDNQGYYLAGQFDVILQNGQMLNDIVVNENRTFSHQISYSEIAPGVYRVLLYGMLNAPIVEHFGEIVNIKLDGNGEDARIENAQFVTFNHDVKHFNSIEAITTGIQNPKSPKLMDIYSADGRLVRSQTTTTKDLSKGIYIINNKKILVK